MKTLLSLSAVIGLLVLAAPASAETCMKREVKAATGQARSLKIIVSDERASEFRGKGFTEEVCRGNPEGRAKYRKWVCGLAQKDPGGPSPFAALLGASPRDICQMSGGTAG